MTLAAGTRLGQYEIVALLGAGGMGEVYRARDAKLERNVAIKILPASFAAEPDRLARFEREARLLASVNHSYIAQIYGLEASPQPFIVMEFVEGGTLADRLRSRDSGLGMRDSLAIARQIIDALDAAHERGIIHRDLKPANIAITHDATVKVLDFGLAKPGGVGQAGAAGWVEGLTHSPTAIGPTMDGVLLGTAPYMSPEQARGRIVDKRTDIWAFGCVLYEMLTGRPAFRGDTTSDTIAAILEREPDWTTLPPSVPPPVKRLLQRCLEKDAKKRLRDIADAREDLDAKAEIVVTENPASNAARHRVIGFVAGLVIAAALGAVAIVMLRTRPAPMPGAPSFSRVVRLTSGPALKSAPVLAPDGKWVAFLSNARGPTDVWVQFLAGGDPINLTASSKLSVQSQSDIGGLGISPDGSTIAFDATDAGPAMVGVWAIPAPAGGAARKLLRAARAAKWSPDGTKIVYVVAGGSSGDALGIADADGSNPHEVAPKLGGMHKHWPSWSSDGRYVYFNYSIATSNSEPSEIYRVPVSGGSVEAVVATTRRAIFPALLPGGRGLIYAANPLTTDLNLWWQSLDGRVRQRLTTGLGEYGQPSLSADGRTLVATFVEPRQSIVVLPVDGEAAGRPRPLIDSSSDFDPALSPDGALMVFASARGGTRNLWMAAADGSDARPLTSGSALDDRPAFSPDGKSIAFVSDRGGVRGVWVVSVGGGSARLIGKAQMLDTISWSPDGSEIVFGTVGNTPGLEAMRVADGTVRRLSVPGSAIGLAGPSWSSRGQIAYIETYPATDGGLTSTNVLIVNANGQSSEPPIALATVGNGAVAWDRTGRRVAVYGNSGAVASAIFLVDPGRPPQKLIEFPPDVRLRGMAWSADGHSLLVGQLRRTSDIVLFDAVR